MSIATAPAFGRNSMKPRLGLRAAGRAMTLEQAVAYALEPGVDDTASTVARAAAVI